MLYCKQCGEENPDNALYCRACGSKLEEKVKKAEVIDNPTASYEKEETSTTTSSSNNHKDNDWIGCCICLIAIFVIFGIIGML